LGKLVLMLQNPIKYADTEMPWRDQNSLGNQK